MAINTDIAMAEAMDKSIHKTEITALVGCVLLSAALCLLQILGSSLLLAAGLGVFLLFILWACFQNRAFHLLLFFLPWSLLLRMYSGGVSFFTIAQLLCCLVYFLRNHMRVRLFQICLTAAMAVLTLAAKGMNEITPDKSYIFFLAMLFLFPCVAARICEDTGFFEITLFFSVGIISAALFAQLFSGYPNISQYIDVIAYQRITRLSGFYEDPNFYSAQIVACLGGTLLLWIQERRELRRILMAVLSLVLLYCGFLSASKSFILVLAMQVLFYVPFVLNRNNRGNKRIRIFLGAAAALVIVISSSAFQELFRVIDDRFAYAANLSQLTTGRTDLWKNYLRAFLRDPVLTFLGIGYSQINLNNRAGHNTLIQLIYQFGLLGTPFFLSWLIINMKNTVKNLEQSGFDRKALAVLSIGVFVPWLGLDILFFDEVFLLPVYIIIGAYHLNRSSAVLPAVRRLSA